MPSRLKPLSARAFAPPRIQEESFVSPRAAQGSVHSELATILRNDGSRQAFEVKPGQSLLDATLDAGETISFSCMSGGCGACRVTLIEGGENIALDVPNERSTKDCASASVPACITRLLGPVTFCVGE